MFSGAAKEGILSITFCWFLTFVVGFVALLGLLIIFGANALLTNGFVERESRSYFPVAVTLTALYAACLIAAITPLMNKPSSRTPMAARPNPIFTYRRLKGPEILREYETVDVMNIVEELVSGEDKEPSIGPSPSREIRPVYVPPSSLRTPRTPRTPRIGR